MAMGLDDYSRLLDTLENEHGAKFGAPQFNDEFLPRGTTVRTVPGSGPSLAKARLHGTNGKLGQNGPIGTTASQGNLALSQSAERQYFDGQDRVARSYRARQAGRVADILAEWG